MKLVKIDGKEYYQYELKCPFGKQNCDCRPDAKKVTIKAPAGYKILSLTLSTSCPLSVYTYTYANGKRTVHKKLVPCYIGAGNVTAKLLDKNGSIFLLTQRPLDDLDKRYLFSRCGGNGARAKKKLLGFIPLQKKLLYRKYLIRKSNLVKAGS